MTALQSGVTGATALDVTCPEPLPRLPSLLSLRRAGCKTGGLCKSAMNTNGCSPNVGSDNRLMGSLGAREQQEVALYAEGSIKPPPQNHHMKLQRCFA